MKTGYAATIRTSGRYYHSGTMHVDVTAIDEEGDETAVTRDDELELTGALRAFADWIYRQLETEYNYQNSDEQVAETIKANEYEFTVEGERF